MSAGIWINSSAFNLLHHKLLVVVFVQQINHFEEVLAEHHLLYSEIINRVMSLRLTNLIMLDETLSVELAIELCIFSSDV